MAVQAIGETVGTSGSACDCKFRDEEDVHKLDSRIIYDGLKNDTLEMF